MSALVKERTDLETKLEQAVRLQSPVLRLPSELLSRIFSIGVLEMGDGTDENPIMVPTLMLVWWTLRRVVISPSMYFGVVTTNQKKILALPSMDLRQI